MRRPTDLLSHPVGLLVLAAAVRAIVAARTCVPGRDSEHYLWVTEQVALGRFEAVFETAFHPVYPLLVAPLLWCFPALDTVTAGQLVSCGLGALAVLPLFAVAGRLFGRHAAIAACFLYAVGIWFARHPADCLSEGPFYLFVAGVVWLLSQHNRPGTPKLLAAGALAGLAFGVRPEGASLVIIGAPWLWLIGVRQGVLAYLLGFAATALPWQLCSWMSGSGFTLTPKLSFNYAVGIGQADDGVLHYFGHLAQVPGELFEALGYVATPMIMVGLFLARPWSLRSPATLIVGLFLLQVAVIPFLRSHFRYLSGYGFLLLIFAGVTWRELLPRLGAWPRPLLAGAVLLAVAGDIVRIPQTRRENRLVLIELGHYLGARLGPGETVATDMPRLGYFAGTNPGTTRKIRREDILEWCTQPATRFAAVIERSTGVTEEDFVALGFEPMDVPPELHELMAARSILAYQRR